MKKLSLAILLTTLIGFNSYGFTSNPPIKGLDSIVKSFDQCLTSFFDHEINLDESLKSSCIKFVESELAGEELMKDKKYAYFYQMWTFEDHPSLYKVDGIKSSLNKMINRETFSDYLPYIEGNKFWVEVIEKNNKYYLVVAVN